MSLLVNKKAGFDYEFLDKLHAGIELFGFEVKSLKKSQGSLDGAYVTIRNHEAFLKGAFIPPYQQRNTPEEYAPRRDRRLLLNYREIDDLLGAEKQRGLTVIPLAFYNKSGRVKLELAIARGKKKHDKRETIKKRDAQRELGRRLKGA